MRLLKNSIANVFGLAGPALINLVTLPFIVKALGDVGFGVYTLVMAIIGYFAVLNLNVTVGAVKYIAEYDSLGKKRELNQVASLGLGIYTIIGAVGALLILVLADVLVRRFFSVPPASISLAITATRLGALGFLFLQLESFLTGVVQGLGKFTVSAGYQIARGFLIPVLTVAILWMGADVVGVVGLRVLLGLAGVIGLAVVAYWLVPGFKLVMPSKDMFKKVASFSMFSYFSTLASVVYFQADKLIIGALIGVAVLPYYVIPFTLASRLMGLSYRMAQVIYPEASRLSALNQLERLGDVYFSAARYIFFLNTYLWLIIAVFGAEILYYWMGPAYAARGHIIMILILSASLIDSLTNIPAMINDGLGHPKVTGLFSLALAAAGLALIALGTWLWGIEGAALAQLVNYVLYTIGLLIYVHGRTVPFRLRDLVRRSYAPIIFPAAALASASLLLRPDGILRPWSLAAFMSVVVLIWTVYGAVYVLEPRHRIALQTSLRARLHRQ